MNLPEVAMVVQSALLHFDQERYRLHAWCVMPNHVHVIVEPLATYGLPSITHTWKSYTSHAINKRLKRRGAVWQKESFDHLIRNEASYFKLINYVLENPRRAKLRNWTWVGRRTQDT